MFEQKDNTFLMYVDLEITDRNRDTYAVGRVEKGKLRKGEKVEIIGVTGGSKITVVKDIKFFNKSIEQAEVGMNVYILLDKISRDEIKVGQIIAKPGTVKLITEFEAQISMLTKEETIAKPLFKGNVEKFRFRLNEVSGTLEFPNDLEMLIPGDNVTTKIKLIAPVAIEEGLKFTIRDVYGIIAKGIVSNIIE